MPAKRRKDQQAEPAIELLRNLLIAQLGLAGVAQAAIREIAGCDMNRVNRIVKPIKKALKAKEK